DGRIIPARPPSTRTARGIRGGPRLLLRPRARPARRPRRPRSPLRRRLFAALDRGPGPAGRGTGLRHRPRRGRGPRGGDEGKPRQRRPPRPGPDRRGGRPPAAVRTPLLRPRVLGGALPRAGRGGGGRRAGALGARRRHAARRAGRDWRLRGLRPRRAARRREAGRGVGRSVSRQEALRRGTAGKAGYPAPGGPVRCAVARLPAGLDPAPGPRGSRRGRARPSLRLATRDGGKVAWPPRGAAGACPAGGVHAAGDRVRRGDGPRWATGL
ncbi:MAG: hypothetical protein AVDCRST_MAG02-843, partial [uncultured Rubrobacteraceae bacterium]